MFKRINNGTTTYKDSYLAKLYLAVYFILGVTVGLVVK